MYRESFAQYLTPLMEHSVDSLTELPFGLPGKIYRSPMPFGPYDAAGIIFEAYKSHHVSVVVVLAENDECLQKAKRNLHAFYTEQGLEVICSPIRDFSVPSLTDLQMGLNQIIACHVRPECRDSLFSGDWSHRPVRCAAGPSPSWPHW
jgi:hypothetical protein